MGGPSLLVLVLLSASAQLPALVGQRAVTRERHIFARESEVTIAVPPEKNPAWSIALELDGTRLELALQPERGPESHVLRVRLPPEQHGSGVLRLLAHNEETKRWPVAVLSLSDDAPEVAEAAQLRKDRKLDEAIKKLEAPLASPSSWVRVWAQVERGHVAYVAGDRAAAEEWWARASASASHAGIGSEAGLRMMGVSFIRYQRREYERAEQALRSATAALEGFDAAWIKLEVSYHLGLLHQHMGEYMAAVRVLRGVVRGADLYGRGRQMIEAREALGLSLLFLGSYREAQKLFDEITNADGDTLADARWRYHNFLNRGFIRQAAIEAGVLPRNYSDARNDYQQAWELARESKIPQRIALVRVRRAQLALTEGNLEQAEAELGELDGDSKEILASTRWDLLLTRAKLLLKRRNFDSAEAIAREVRQGSLVETKDELNEFAVAAMMLFADIERERGRRAKAIQRYREALEALDHLATRTGATRAKAHLAFKGSPAVESLAELLLAEKKVGPAFAVLARSQSDALEDLEAAVRVDQYGAHWRDYRRAQEVFREARTRGCQRERPSERKSCEAKLRAIARDSDAALQTFYGAAGSEMRRKQNDAELVRLFANALAEDESLLAIFRLRDKWITFLLRKNGLVHELGDTPPRSWMEKVPKDGHVYVLLGEHTESLELHQADGPGRALLAAAYSMSYLPSAWSLLERAPRPEGPALVVADPDSTLPGARPAGAAVVSQLGGATYLVGEQATRAELTKELRSRSVFHFIGHASLLDGDPWTTELRLARGETLGVADVLSLRPKLGLAVLEGCTTGARTPTGELGLPQVMIAAGARTVLATVRDLDAGEATQFLRRFYEAGGSNRPAYAFREAIRGSLAANDPSWRAFRLWGLR